MPSVRQDLAALPREAWVISAGLFVNKFGNFVNVFIVLYLTARGYSPAQAGIALAVIGLGNFVGNALGGLLADVAGRRATIIVSMFGSGLITMTVPVLTSSLTMTVAGLGVLGVFAQLFRPAAGALLVDAVRDDQLLTAFTLLRLAINVGMAVGPAVGGLLSSYSYTWLFIADGLTSIVYGLLALFLLRDSPRATSTDSAAARTAAADAASFATKQTAGYAVVVKDHRYLAYLLSMVAATYVYSQATATLPLHARAQGLSNETFGLLLGLNALLVVALELPITRLTGRYTARPVIAAGLALLGVGMAATGASQGVTGIAATIVVWTLGEMVYTPVANAYPGQVAPANARGRYQGAEGLAHTLGATLGPAAGGLLYAANPPWHWLVCLLVAVAGAALIFLSRAVASHPEALVAAPATAEKLSTPPPHCSPELNDGSRSL